tara:strand:- start:30 stop:248 length:219 start_codon:yes stop_codon:yes gene_type:complete
LCVQGGSGVELRTCWLPCHVDADHLGAARDARNGPDKRAALSVVRALEQHVDRRDGAEGRVERDGCGRLGSV